MEPENFGEVRKIIVALAMRTKGDIGFYYGLPFVEVLGIIKEVAELGKRKQ